MFAATRILSFTFSKDTLGFTRGRQKAVLIKHCDAEKLTMFVIALALKGFKGLVLT